MIHGEIEGAHHFQTENRQKPGNSDQYFDPAVQGYGPDAPLSPPPEERTACRKPAHEGSEHCRDCIHGMPKHQAKSLSPRHLIDESGYAGNEKARQDDYKG